MTFNDFNEYRVFIKENPYFTGFCVVLPPNGRSRYERNFVNGKYHGKQHGWYPNGKKGYEGNYNNGEQHGIQHGWYEHGQKSYEYNFVDGEYHGKQFGWHSNGQKSHEFNYVNGRKIGIQFDEGKIYESVINDCDSIWYIFVKETL